jgi:Rrf2 family iron-sulfur cluster assembly transcriptional regulator
MRLEITRRSDLATRALLELARTDERTKASVLAEAVGTTPGFLSQAMTPLVARGWAGSEPGPTGGYTVLVDPADLTVLEVIEAVEGPTDTGRCVLEDRACAGAGAATGLCALHRPWSSARAQLLGELASTPLSSLLEKGPAE